MLARYFYSQIQVFDRGGVTTLQGFDRAGVILSAVCGVVARTEHTGPITISSITTGVILVYKLLHRRYLKRVAVIAITI